MIGVSGSRTYPAAAVTPQAVTGITYTADNIVRSVPVAVKHSVTLVVEPLSASDVDVSFDSGTTWPYQATKGSARSWGSDAVNGAVLTQMRFRPKGGSGTATYSLHGD